MPSKTRLKKSVKLSLARRIADAAVAEVQTRVTPASVGNVTEGIFGVEIGSLQILHTTRFPKLPGRENATGIDIWTDGKGKGKVFSARWEPFEVVRFDYGDWVHDILLKEILPWDM